MLRKLVDEVMRRRLWPIIAIALLVAVAAPLLFLKSAPPPAPSAATVAPETGGALPERARRLLASREAAQRAARRRAGSASDPFQPPRSGTKSASAGSKAADESAASAADGTIGAGATTTPDKGPVEVVITNSDGTPATPATPTAPISDDGAATKSGTQSTTAVDVRFGATYPGSLHRAIPSTQTFLAGSRVVAIFVKYSPARDKAVFAIAPSTVVSGDVECRRKEDLCRYVDIPAGESVRLTTSATDGTLVTRRLAVERIQRTDAATSAAPANASCLLSKLLTLTADDLSPTTDACPS